jgi:hypothetical protein
VFYTRADKIGRRLPFVEFIYGEAEVESGSGYKGIMINKKLGISLTTIAASIIEAITDFKNSYNHPIMIDYFPATENEDVVSKARYFNSIISGIYNQRIRISDKRETYIFKN